jgi:hypothetical protein
MLDFEPRGITAIETENLTVLLFSSFPFSYTGTVNSPVPAVCHLRYRCFRLSGQLGMVVVVLVAVRAFYSILLVNKS